MSVVVVPIHPYGLSKNLEKFKVDFFNRTNLAFVSKDKIQLLPLNQLPYAFENGFILEDTLFFNNVIQTKSDLENKSIIPIKIHGYSRELK